MNENVRRPSPTRTQPTVKVLTPVIAISPTSRPDAHLRPAAKYEITQMYGGRGFYSGKWEHVKPGDPRYDPTKPPDQQRREDVVFKGVGDKRTTTDKWVADFFCGMMTYRTEKGDGRTIEIYKDQVYKFYVVEIG
uniref:Uncharacterized protein n=1 Tax=viral metagenome TaxID=1070528 RepID=A0A6M3J1Z1_9ZZZZ